MANALMKQPEEEDTDPFARFAREYGNQTHIQGDLLRFTKHGQYKAGQDQEAVELGTRVLAYIPGLMDGYVKWQDQKPVKHVIGLVADDFMAPSREELGDLDQDLWPELNGRRVDPWQHTQYLPMLDDTGQLYTYVTSSKGGLNMLTDLSQRYSDRHKMYPDDIPIIKLMSRSYVHPDFGETFAPVFKIDGWAKTPSNFDELKKSMPSDDMLEAKTEVFLIKNGKSKQPAKAAAPAARGKDKTAAPKRNRF